MIDMRETKKVLSIAGSDSGGGAGIQADLKTFAALGVYGMTAITAITAQNTLGVSSIQDVDPNVIADQIDVVVQDIGVDAVKIGMLHSSEIIHVVSEKIRKYDLKPVLDPVMVSTSGSELLRPEAKQALIMRLLPLAKVLTPNRHEAEILSGIKIETIEDAKEAARKIAEMGAENVLVKGGRLESKDKASDILYSNGKYTVLDAKYHDTRNTHGTGCSLSSAIAAQLAKGNNVLESVRFAKEFVNKAIKNGLDLGKGPGPVNPMSVLYDETEKLAVLENLRKAVAIVESEPKLRGLVAECQMNIGMALSNANGPMDVAAVDGRLTKHMDGVRAAGYPRFGASKHIASTILAVKEHDPMKRAALNLKYSMEAVKTCRELGLTVSYYDRQEEPEEIKEIEGMTTAWGAREAIKRAGKTPDVIYHHGDWGKEAMIVLVGESAVEVASWAADIAKRLVHEF
jgi:hydroxymethylpyrimidine/phosphomethylpyrimidine kinase